MVHRKGVGAGGGYAPSRANAFDSCTLKNAILRNYEYIIRPTNGGGARAPGAPPPLPGSATGEAGENTATLQDEANLHTILKRAIIIIIIIKVI